jgi:flagellar FliJ protein
MARFIFKLHAALEQREFIEHQKQIALAETQRKLAEAKAKFDQLEADVRAANDHIRQHQLAGRLDTRLLASHRVYLMGMKNKVIEAARGIAMAQQQVDQARAALAEAAKDRKAIELLRDKQRERWQAEQMAMEQKDLDEAGTQIAYQNLRAAEVGD